MKKLTKKQKDALFAVITGVKIEDILEPLVLLKQIEKNKNNKKRRL